MTNGHAKAAALARAARVDTSRPRRSPEDKFAYAVVLSSLLHALLLCLTFGDFGWLPGFIFPWQVRRSTVPELSVVLVPARITPAEPPVVAQAPAPAAPDVFIVQPAPRKAAQPKPKT